MLNGTKLRHKERSEMDRRTPVNYATFTSKGRPSELAMGYDDYTQSFNRTFGIDREQAKTYAISSIADRMARGKPRTPGANQRRSRVSFMTHGADHARSPADTTSDMAFDYSAMK